MDAGGDARNDNRRDGDGSDAERQFIKAVCVIEPRHRGWRGGRDGGCRDQLELWDAGGDQARQGPLEKHAGLVAHIYAIAPPALACRQPGSCRYEELSDARHGHSKGKPSGEIEMVELSIREQDQRQYHHQIEQDRTARNDADTALSTQSGRQYRDEPRQDNIRRDYEKQKRCKQLPPLIETWGDGGDHELSEKNGKQSDGARDAEERHQDAPCETVCLRSSVLTSAQFEPDWYKR